MKTTFLLFSACLLSIQIQAQSSGNGCLSNNHLKYYNGFQHTCDNPERLNTALSHAQHLAKACPPSLRGLFHTFYAQSFSKRIRGNRPNTTELNLLAMLMQDTSQVITQTLQPITAWIKIQENEHNPEALSRLTKEFITTQLQPGDWQENRTARYAFLIYQMIQPKKELVPEAQTLLSKTMDGLADGLKKYTLPGDNLHSWKRAWYRYLFAYGNFLQAEEARQKGDMVRAEKYYRTAAGYSPDASDKSAKPSYDYDVAFLIGKDKSNGFEEDYLAFLETNFNKTEALKILTQLSLSDPVHLSRLQSFYTIHYSKEEAFEQYWHKQLLALPLAPAFDMTTLSNGSFSLETQKGKWVFLDFWGTWCEPCIKEMPQMQSLYREMNSKHAGRFSLLTIACKDTEAKVKTYLNKNRYNFPVVMSDEVIENEYAVSQYPTKVLITPQGTMIVLSGDGNWVEKVKLYCRF